MTDSSEHNYTRNVPPFPSLVMRLVLALAIFVSGALVGEFWRGSALTIAKPDTKCIPPEYPLAYPSREGGEFGPPKNGLVPETWKPLLTIPDSRIRTPDYIVHRDVGEIWLLDWGKEVLKISEDTGEITELFLDSYDQVNYITEILHSTSSGEIITLGQLKTGNGNRSIFVARYSEEDRVFRIIGSREGSTLGGGASALVETKNGDIWVVLGESLWHLSTQKWKFTEILGPEQGYRLFDLVQDKQGFLWVVFELTASEVEQRGGSYAVNTWYLLKINIETMEIEEGSSPPGTQKYSTGAQPKFSIFIDDQNRIWANDYGWLQVNESGFNEWYVLVRSPIFVADRNAYPLEYGWFRPEPEMQTEGRYIWFTSRAGVAKLDLETEQWCLLNQMVTSSLASDDAGRIWAASNGQIYVYDPHND